LRKRWLALSLRTKAVQFRIHSFCPSQSPKNEREIDRYRNYSGVLEYPIPYLTTGGMSYRFDEFIELQSRACYDMLVAGIDHRAIAVKVFYELSQVEEMARQYNLA